MKPVSKAESNYKGWARHTRNMKGPQRAGRRNTGRIGVSRARRRAGQEELRKLLEDMAA